MEQGHGRVRYAVVGAGHIAQVAVLPAFAHAEENSELVAIVSSDAEKRAELGRRYDVRHTALYDDFETLLNEANVEAVYIALPNTKHREFTERAARAGVHVLCEKPMATNEDDCQAMIAATEENQVRLMIAYRLHFEEANLRAVQIAKSGRIGEARIMSSVFCQQVRPGDIRTQGELGGGALFDLGVYCVNAARYLFRAEPIEVFGYAQASDDERSRDVDETTSALLKFPDHRIAEFTVSQGAADVSTYRLVGTKGDLRVEPAYDYAGTLEHHLTIDGKTRKRRYAKRDQFAAELVYFSRCIQEGKRTRAIGMGRSRRRPRDDGDLELGSHRSSRRACAFRAKQTPRFEAEHREAPPRGGADGPRALAKPLKPPRVAEIKKFFGKQGAPFARGRSIDRMKRRRNAPS